MRSEELVQFITENQGLLLVHFGSPLASACEFVHQELWQLAPELEERVRFATVELPLQDLELIQTYGIEEIPTLILFAGDREVERLRRIMLPEELKEFLDTCSSFYGGEIGGDSV
ncbi:MAG: thioredoxin family protein [Planctomycetota bacterium]